MRSLVVRYGVMAAKVVLFVIAGIVLTLYLDHIPTAE